MCGMLVGWNLTTSMKWEGNKIHVVFREAFHFHSKERRNLAQIQLWWYDKVGDGGMEFDSSCSANCYDTMLFVYKFSRFRNHIVKVRVCRTDFDGIWLYDFSHLLVVPTFVGHLLQTPHNNQILIFYHQLSEFWGKYLIIFSITKR